jgi:hypothetical protein
VTAPLGITLRIQENSINKMTFAKLHELTILKTTKQQNSKQQNSKQQNSKRPIN